MTFGQMALAGLSFALSTAATAGSETVSAMVLDPAKLTISIDANGSPARVACSPRVNPTICPIVVRAVSSWKFTPGKREGHAAAMDIDLTLNLAAVPKQGGFGLQATRADIRLAVPLAAGAPAHEAITLNPPRYPHNEQVNGRTGLVVLELLLQPGSDQAQIGRTWFDRGPASEQNSFVKAAMDAATTWKIDHVPEQLSMCVPVLFTLVSPPTLNGPEPCEATYVDGFAPPTLVTDAASAAF